MILAGVMGAALRSPAVAAAAAAFTPASLSPNIWLEADPTRLYTDAGTTLVSADGQAVQQWNDKSTNARNLSQSTLANRPLYKTGTKPYLLFDGSASTILDGTGRVWLDGSGQHWWAISCNVTDNTLNGYLTQAAGSNLVSNVRLSGTVANIESGDTTPGSTTDSNTAPSSGVDVVLIATVTTTAAEIFVDNASNGATTLTGTRQTNSAGIWIGSNVAFNNFFKGKIYGVVEGSGTITSTDRANLQTYMAALHP